MWFDEAITSIQEPIKKTLLNWKGFLVKNKTMSETNELIQDGFYKGYDIRWLRTETDHPDYYLVAEYDSLMSKVEDQPVEESNNAEVEPEQEQPAQETENVEVINDDASLEEKKDEAIADIAQPESEPEVEIQVSSENTDEKVNNEEKGE